MTISTLYSVQYGIVICVQREMDPSRVDVAIVVVVVVM